VYEFNNSKSIGRIIPVKGGNPLENQQLFLLVMAARRLGHDTIEVFA